MRNQTRIDSGFTLIEVMITVAIVAILASIAYPSYTDYIRRGKIPEALQGLSDMRTRQEQFFLDNRTYQTAGGACGAANATSKSFDFACVANATTYTITATGKAAEGMGGFSYTVDQANVRTSTLTGVSGWSGSATCWVTKKGGVC